MCALWTHANVLKARSLAQAKDAGIEINFGSVISAVEGSHGVTAVKIAAYRKGQGRVITEKKVNCDFIAMSGGWNPALHLWCHNGGKIRFDDALGQLPPQHAHRPDDGDWRSQWHDDAG